jgi:hypothetical protein
VKANTYTMLRQRKLLPWYSIRIATEGDTKYVTFCSTIHVNREVEASPCFSAEFTDYAILDDHDLYSWVVCRYGADLFVKPH